MESMAQPIRGDEDVVLVVDDEEMITQVIGHIVEKDGYRQVSFNDPTEALQHYNGNSQAITLMITDLTMPVLSGPDLIRRALLVNPKLPIILVTGYSDEYIPDDVRPLVQHILRKPFVKSELLDAVRAGLEKGRSSTPIN